MNAYMIPFANACTLITLSYFILKIRNRLINQTHEKIAAILYSGIASILFMLQPVPAYMLVDLRLVPVMMTGLKFGFPAALLTCIPPAVFGLAADYGPSAWHDIGMSLILPAAICSLFHRKNASSYALMRISDGFKACLLLSVCWFTIGLYGLEELTAERLLLHAATLASLTAAIAILIAMLNEENRIWMLQRQLELQANQDGLTRLPNFRSFFQLAAGTLQSRPVAILMIDIDHFKNYNDVHGHLQGDELLKEVGSLLRSTIGEQDYLARYGGEEFIVMSPATDESTLYSLAARLCAAISEQPFAGRERQPGGRVTISVGIAVTKKPRTDLYRLISEADQALYASKGGGRNRFTFWQGGVGV